MILVWLKAAWEWLKKYWKYLIPVVGVLIFLVERLLLAKPPQVTVESGEIVGHDLEQAKEDELAAVKKAQADATETAALQKIDSTHAAAVNDAANKEVAAVQATGDDPDKVNDLLLNVGKDMRK